MNGKLLGIFLVSLVVAPAALPTDAGARGGESDWAVCQELPVKTDAKDIHVGDKTVHLPGRSKPTVCVTADHQVQGTPTITQYKGCGDACFAVRVKDLEVYADLAVELKYSEDGQSKSLGVDPDPVNVTEDMQEVCISNHAENTPDPCVVTILSPSNLRAKGREAAIGLRWDAASEAYGQSDVIGYEVWRSATGEPETFELVYLTDGTSYIDAGLNEGATYHYYVVAFDSSSNRSGGSNVASAKVH